MGGPPGSPLDGDGVGTARPVHGIASPTAPLPAPILDVTGVFPNELIPNVKMTGTGRLVAIDRMVLEASAAVVKAVGAAIEVQGGLDGAMSFLQSRVNVTPPPTAGAVWLDNSFVKVNNGPLLSVTGGTQMTINGDFAFLTNGAKITVQNGPLILVDGTNPGNPAKPTTLQITGGLLSFGTASLNQVIVNNGTASNGSFVSNGVTVPHYTSGGATINAGANAIKSPGTNTISITGSALQAINGAKVGINAAP
jgi:hypothetical protein